MKIFINFSKVIRWYKKNKKTGILNDLNYN